MKKYTIPIALAGALVGPSLQAAMQISLTQNTTQYSSGSGGEFRANIPAAPNNDLSWVVPLYSDKTSGDGYFQTFCVEVSEQFNPGVTYKVELSSAAKYNNNPPNGNDPLSQGTAFLYWQFATGVLAGYDYNYGPGRVADAGELQKAIWALEDESGGVISENIKTILRGEFGTTSTITDWQKNNDGLYPVMVMNLFQINGSDITIQDQLVLVVPEPSTYLAGLGSLGILGLSLRRRNG